MTAPGRAARGLLRAIPGARRTALWLRDHLDPQARSIAQLRRAAPDGLFQPLAETSPNRYPAIFAKVAQVIGDRPAPAILSFGCSTGDEAFSLAALMPHARVTGIDINPHNIRVARQRAATMPDGAPKFFCAAAPAGLPDNGFDAVFCMAVTRHDIVEAQRPLNCSPWLDFAQFDALMAQFDLLLAPGGVLAIWNSHFRFGDSRVAASYAPIFHRAINPAAPPLYYSSDNHRVDDDAPYTAAIFRKRIAT